MFKRKLQDYVPWYWSRFIIIHSSSTTYFLLLKLKLIGYTSLNKLCPHASSFYICCHKQPSPLAHLENSYSIIKILSFLAGEVA